MGKLVVGNFQGIQQRYQWADERGIQATDLVVGFDAATGAGTANGVAEQHPPQAKSPTVLLQCLRQAQAGTLLGIHPPADACPFDPAVQGWQVTLLYAEALP
ncbi:hypothetical protein D3C81_1695340 [compost metagenome]